MGLGRGRSGGSSGPRTVTTLGRWRRTCSIRILRWQARTRKWAADISYIWTKEGWLYLAVVIDLFARRVVGWSTGDRLHRELALAALRKAVVMRRTASGLLHHSDRGSQYCSVDYQAELRAHGILTVMSGRGNCFDNSMVETFFKTLKSELVWRTAFETRADAAAAVG